MWKQGASKAATATQGRDDGGPYQGGAGEVTCAEILDVCVTGGADGNFLME